MQFKLVNYIIVPLEIQLFFSKNKHVIVTYTIFYGDDSCYVCHSSEKIQNHRR